MPHIGRCGREARRPYMDLIRHGGSGGTAFLNWRSRFQGAASCRDALPCAEGCARFRLTDEGSAMPTPAELRERSGLAQQAAEREAAPHLKRLLASHAFALAQLAEKIEREEAGREPLSS